MTLTGWFSFPRHGFPTHASRAGAQWPVPPVSETSVGPARAVTSSSYYLAAYLIFTDDRSHLAARLVLYRVVRGVAWMKGVNVPIKWGGRHQFSALPSVPSLRPPANVYPKMILYLAHPRYAFFFLPRVFISIKIFILPMRKRKFQVRLYPTTGCAI